MRWRRLVARVMREPRAFDFELCWAGAEPGCRGSTRVARHIAGIQPGCTAAQAWSSPASESRGEQNGSNHDHSKQPIRETWNHNILVYPNRLLRAPPLPATGEQSLRWYVLPFDHVDACHTGSPRFKFAAWVLRLTRVHSTPGCSPDRKVVAGTMTTVTSLRRVPWLKNLSPRLREKSSVISLALRPLHNESHLPRARYPIWGYSHIENCGHVRDMFDF